MTMAISVAEHEGAEAVICASTGNTSASMAAYAAKAGLKPLVLVPEGKIAPARWPRRSSTARRSSGPRQLRRLPATWPAALSWRLPRARWSTRSTRSASQGQKTAAFEIVDCLGDAPDFHLLPVGNAGNITAYWLRLRRVRRRSAWPPGSP